MTKRRPDIVLIVLDTQRADHLSGYGYPAQTSPHLDALAAESARFTQAISTAQWTLPAHASLFTGLYPSQHTMTQLDSVLPPTVPTLAERLQQAGYFTAAFSNNPLIGAKNNGLQRGFAKIANYSSLDLGLWVSHLEEGPPSTGLKKYRRYARRWLARLLGYGQTETVRWTANILGPLVESLLKFRGGTKDDQARQSLAAALDLLLARREVEARQPIFTFINLMGTHTPYAPPRWAARRFVPGPGRKQSLYALLHRANSIGLDVNNWLETDLAPETYTALLRGMYDAETAAQDAQLGYFFGRLREAGALEQTWLMIVADHGDHLGEKQRISHLFGAYQELVRVPLIIRRPTGAGSKPDRDEFVSIRRLFHTALAAAGIATPAEARLDLMAETRPGDDWPESDVAFVEAETPAWVINRLEKQRPGLVRRKGYARPVRAVYSQGHKLIVKDQDIVELYAVRDDPHERQNLTQALPARTTRLKAMLDHFIEQSRPAGEALIQPEADPAVLTRLRELGYIE